MRPQICGRNKSIYANSSKRASFKPALNFGQSGARQKKIPTTNFFFYFRNDDENDDGGLSF
jgi:hypothetical protein